MRLTTAPGAEQLASFSPDGAFVGFVRDNNLYAVEIRNQREHRLTTDGSEKILNGILDWVYEEEIYGRGERRAYWWSPDSTRVAFLRLDDTPVPQYVTVDDIPYEQVVERWDWPKAGDPNPLVSLGIVRASGGPILWANADKYPPADRLIVNVSWTPDSRQVVHHVTNRIQTWLDLNVADARSGVSRTVLREKSPAFLDPGDYQPPTWLKDGSFLWISDTSGWKHLFHYKADGTRIRQITSGKWEMRTLARHRPDHGVDLLFGH